MRAAGGKHEWPLPAGIDGDAVFSEDGEYRYVLHRRWATTPGSPMAMFVGLNPSTAMASVDDPTVRKCWRWAHSWGFKAMAMLNVYAYRATNPTDLTGAAGAGVNPIGLENDEYLLRYGQACGLVVAAWGTLAGARGDAVRSLLAGVSPLHCLGTNINGTPRHPLYLRNDTTPEPWT